MTKKHLFVSICALCFAISLYSQTTVSLNTCQSAHKQLDVAYGAKENTIFKVSNRFDLKNRTINLPASSVLDFQGGSFTNGVLNGNNTRINAPLIRLFDNVQLTGSWILDGIRVEWFGAKPNLSREDCSDAINQAIVAGSSLNVPVLLSSANYYIKKTIILDAVGIQGVNSQQSIITYAPSLDVAVYLLGQYRAFKNVRIQSSDPSKKKGVCLKVGDISSFSSSTRGYIEDVVVTGGDIGLDLQYQWCYKISGIIAKNNNIGIRVSKTNTIIDNAIIEDNIICGVLSAENGVKLLSSVIEGNSIGCYFNGKENALMYCYFEGNELKKGVTPAMLNSYGIKDSEGGHFLVGLDRTVSNMIVVGCHISPSQGQKRMMVDRCQNFILFGNTNMDTIETTKRCKVKVNDQ